MFLPSLHTLFFIFPAHFISPWYQICQLVIHVIVSWPISDQEPFCWLWRGIPLIWWYRELTSLLLVSPLTTPGPFFSQTSRFEWHLAEMLCLTSHLVLDVKNDQIVVFWRVQPWLLHILYLFDSDLVNTLVIISWLVDDSNADRSLCVIIFRGWMNLYRLHWVHGVVNSSTVALVRSSLGDFPEGKTFWRNGAK